jgi:hypothetical protein
MEKRILAYHVRRNLELLRRVSMKNHGRGHNETYIELAGTNHR